MIDSQYAEASATAPDAAVHGNAAQQRHIRQSHADYEMRGCVRSAGTLIKQYSRRWTIEPSFRDTKDLRFGMGMAEIRIPEPERRDRLLLVSALAMALLTMLGTAGERQGMERQLTSNTSKIRSHSLFRQGCIIYELIPNMPKHRLLPLMQRFTEMLRSSCVFTNCIPTTK